MDHIRALLLISRRKTDFELVASLIKSVTPPPNLDVSDDPDAALDLMEIAAHDAYLIDQSIGPEFIERAVTRGVSGGMILLADADDPALDEAALKAGAAGFLVKSALTTADLMRTLRYTTRLHTHLDEQQRRAQRYEGVLEHQAEFIGRFTPEFKLTYANDAYQNLLPDDPAIRNDLLQIVPPEEREGVITHLGSLTPDNAMSVRANHNIMPDGSVRWIQWTNRALFDADGQVIEFQSVGRDITEQKEQEQALRESEERYRTLIELSPEPILVLQDDRIVYANAATVRLYGAQSPEDFAGKSLYDFAPSEERAGIRKHLAIMARPNYRPMVIPGKLLRLDGRMLDVEARGAPIVYEGKPAVLAHLRDITLRLENERALRESEERFRAIVESQQDLIVRWKPGGIRTYVNNAYCRYFGGTREAIIGTSFFPHVSPEDRAKLRDELSTLSAENPSFSESHRVIRADDKPGWNEWAHHAIFDDEGNFVEVQSVGRDITARTLADDAIRESEARYRQLVELSPDGIIVVMGEHIRFANSVAATLFGVGSVDDLVGRNLFDFVVTRFREPLEQYMQAVLAEGRSRGPTEGRIFRPDGHLLPVEAHAARITFEGNTAMLGFIRDITARKEAERALHDHQRELETVAKVSRVATSTLDPVAMAAQVAQVIGESIDVTSVMVCHLNFDKLTSTAIAQYLSNNATARERPNRVGIDFDLNLRPRLIAMRDEPDTLVEWQRDDPTLNEDERSMFSRTGIISALDVPLRAGGAAIGYLALWETRFRRTFSESERRVLRSVGSVVGVALANAKLYEELRAQQGELETVAHVARVSTATLDITRMLTDVAQVICDAIDVTTAYIFGLDSSFTKTRILAEYFSEAASAAERIPRIGEEYTLDQRPLVRRWQQEPEHFAEWQRDDPSLAPQEREVFESRNLLTALGVPLRSGGRVIGFMALWESRKKRHFTDSERRLLGSVGGLVGVVLANAQLYEELRASEERYRSLFEGINDVVFVHDSEGRILDVNDVACQRMGYTREEFLKLTIYDLDAPEYAAGFADRWQQQIKHGKLSNLLGQHVTKDGRLIDIDANTTVITRDGQQVVLALARDITKMKQQEQALRDRHRELETVARVAQAATSTLDIQQMLTEAAQVICEAIDVTAASFFDVDFDANAMNLLAEYFSEAANAAEKVSRKGMQFSLEERPGLLRWKDDPELLLERHASDVTFSGHEREMIEARKLRTALGVPLRVGGRVIGFISLWESRRERNFDETERRVLKSIGGMMGVALANAQLYGELRASEERYRSLVELSPDAILVHADDKVAYINRAGLELYGADAPEQILGTSPLERVPPHLHDYVRQRWKEVFEADGPLLPRRSQAVRLDGEIVDVGAAGVRIIWDGRQAMLILLRDITAEREHQRRMQNYVYLLENASDAIISLDENFKVETWNPAAASLYGWTEAEMLGHTIVERIPTDYLSASREQFIEEFLAEGQWRGEVIRTTKTGEQVYVLISTYAILDEFGKLTGSVGINTDITALKESEQQRLDLTRERERVEVLRRFVGDATHDLGTPLTNIRSSLYLLSRVQDEDKRVDYMLGLAAQAEKLEKLLGNMLSMTRLDDPATAELLFTAQDVNLMVQEVAEQLAPTIERKRHTVHFELAADLPRMTVDRNEFMRALEEIMLNAIYYTPNGGQITLRTLREAACVIIEVQDNGIGIAQGDLPRIFERFYRADRARSSETGGAGLGLPLARKILEAHAGEVEVISVVDEGSTFRICLPIK